jgi:hypothetical protein
MMHLQDKDPSLKPTILDMLDPRSLPLHWIAQYDDATGRRYYVHAPSDRKIHEHPNIGYYRGVVFMEKGGLAQMMENIESDPPAEDDIQAMSEYLDVAEDDVKMVKDVVVFVCCAPLPQHFLEIDSSNGETLFRYGTPCDPMLLCCV